MYYLIKESLIFSNWFCSTNHKVIGILYLFFGTWIAFLAMLNKVQSFLGIMTNSGKCGSINVNIMESISSSIIPMTKIITYGKKGYSLCNKFNGYVHTIFEAGSTSSRNLLIASRILTNMYFSDSSYTIFYNRYYGMTGRATSFYKLPYYDLFSKYSVNFILFSKIGILFSGIISVLFLIVFPSCVFLALLIYIYKVNNCMYIYIMKYLYYLSCFTSHDLLVWSYSLIILIGTISFLQIYMFVILLCSYYNDIYSYFDAL